MSTDTICIFFTSISFQWSTREIIVLGLLTLSFSESGAESRDHRISSSSYSEAAKYTATIIPMMLLGLD